MKTTAVVLSVLLAAAFGCATLPPGTLMHPPQNPRLASGGPYTLAVAPPTDSRPAIEHEGDHPRTRIFFTLIFFWWIEKRGNWVTNDYASSPDLVAELERLTGQYLQRTGMFQAVVPAGQPADFLLESDVRHLYGTYYEARRTVAVVSGDRHGPTDYHQTTSKVAFAPYGNAVIRYRLYDTRRGKKHLVWQRTVTGAALMAPKDDARKRLPLVVREAAARALTAMVLYVTRAVDEYAPLPFDTVAFTAALESQMRTGELQFVIERHSQRRTASEQLTIDARSGRIVGHRLVPNAAVPVGRPGDWLLSRDRPDGTLMPYVAYATLASFLSRHFDLRRVDEIYHYHFFGRVGRSQVEGRRPVAVAVP